MQKNKKEYLKIHIVAGVNAKTKKKILSVMIKVTDEDEHVHDDSNKALPELVDGILKSDKTVVGKVFADGGAYEGNDIFRCLPDKGILSCVKVRINSGVLLKRGNFRNLSV